MSVLFEDKFSSTHRNFDKVLEDIFEKMRELEDNIAAIPIQSIEEEETPSSSESSISDSISTLVTMAAFLGLRLDLAVRKLRRGKSPSFQSHKK